jgi:hypothetical protein
MKVLPILSAGLLALGLAFGPTIAEASESLATPHGVVSGKAADKGDANQTTASDLGTPGSAKFKAACADAIANPDRHQDILAMCKNTKQ